jgi:hypothetical protein
LAGQPWPANGLEWESIESEGVAVCTFPANGLLGHMGLPHHGPRPPRHAVGRQHGWRTLRAGPWAWLPTTQAPPGRRRSADEAWPAAMAEATSVPEYLQYAMFAAMAEAASQGAVVASAGVAG